MLRIQTDRIFGRDKAPARRLSAENGLAVFELIRGHRALASVVHCAFDLIELDGEDLRRTPRPRTIRRSRDTSSRQISLNGRSRLTARMHFHSFRQRHSAFLAFVNAKCRKRT